MLQPHEAVAFFKWNIALMNYPQQAPKNICHAVIYCAAVNYNLLSQFVKPNRFYKNRRPRVFYCPASSYITLNAIKVYVQLRKNLNSGKSRRLERFIVPNGTLKK